MNYSFYQQHVPEEPPQSQTGSVPLINPFMTAVAHPTPDFTYIAPDSQFLAQAPHSMHRPALTGTAFLS